MTIIMIAPTLPSNWCIDAAFAWQQLNLNWTHCAAECCDKSEAYTDNIY